MAEHDLDVRVPKHSVKNRPVKLVVDSDGERWGVLSVSKGGLRWRPANSQTRYLMGWKKLDELMAEHGKPC